MSLIRWEPFTGMDEMFGRFPTFFGRMPRLSTNGDGELDWVPPVDISETEQEYLIRASLPSVKKDDVKVTFDDGMLTLSGERRREETRKDEKYHKVESYYGSFARSFTLPDGIDAGAIRAESKDGVLVVHVPKTKVEAAKTNKVQ